MNSETGFLSSFLSKGLKTNQLEVNTDEKTLRPIARLKEPRDLFALPRDKENDCPQQAPRWPIECQVIEERIVHIPYVPPQPEPYYQPTGNELKPHPVGEDAGVVVFNYNPISAVNYDIKEVKLTTESSDSDISSSESRASTPKESMHNMELKAQENPFTKMLEVKNPFSKLLETLHQRSPSCSHDDEDDDEDDEDDDEDDEEDDTEGKCYKTQEDRQKGGADEIEDIWANKSPEYQPATPTFIKSQFGKNVPKIYTQQNDCTNFIAPFSRSAIGGSKILTNCHPSNYDEAGEHLEFESRFECGNLAKAVKITESYYELYLRPDLYTSRSKQWFYFRVRRTKKSMVYRFSIVNLVKSDSLYNEGMRPLMYSTTAAEKSREGWRRCGDNIRYYRNDEESNSNDEDDENASYTLTFNIEFPYDDDTVYFAHSYPYTYTDLQEYLMEIQKHPVKSKYCKLRLLCRSLAGNNVYYLTVTAPTQDEEAMRRKKAVVVSARVHPSEVPASWMMKGLMDFITGDSQVAKRLRHKFIFKLIPMLNPDGVIVGNTRNSLTGKDLNRQYRTVIRETYPSIWYTKAMIKRLIDECGIAMYCDMHAHSRKHNIFIYGCENRRTPEKKLTEQVFPLMMHKNVADKFSFESCKFKIQRSKEGTGRIVMWMLGITNSYTIEASFGGTSLGSRKGTHFNTADYEQMGRAFCETLLDYCDENPNKERLRLKIIERLLKEGSSADEPLNIPLSDYSSDEGDTSSSSDNEGKDSFSVSDLEGPCCAPLKAPPTSPETAAVRRRKCRPRRCLPLRKKRDPADRTPLDMPTTDPGSDIIFSTDDEMYFESHVHETTYGTVPRTRRTLLLQSELQRRYIEEIGDAAILPQKIMPPELIVTSPTKSNSESTKKETVLLEPPMTAPGKYGISEFPMPSELRERTGSWQNLHTTKFPSKLRFQNNFNTEQRITTDDLQLKLSLKKKIWSVVQPEFTATTLEKCRTINRSLSPMPLKKDTRREQKKETYRTEKRDDNELLLTACSQKLLAWQLSGSNLQPIENPNKKQITVNLLLPNVKDTQNYRILSSMNAPKTAPKSLSKIETSSSELHKMKLKKNSLSKIAETTQLITRLAKSKSRPFMLTAKKMSKTSNNNSSSTHTVTNASKTVFSANKFKTGGIVATAVQSKHVHRKKKHGNPGTTLQNNNTSGEKTNQRTHDSNNDSSMNITSKSEQFQSGIVRKVKFKMKKKKRSSSANAK